MHVTEIRKELHRAIDEIENKELLEAMLVILEQNSTGLTGYEFTDEQLQVIKEREAACLKGESKPQTLEAFREK